MPDDEKEGENAGCTHSPAHEAQACNAIEACGTPTCQRCPSWVEDPLHPELPGHCMWNE